MGSGLNLTSKRTSVILMTCVLFVAGAATYSAIRTPIYEASTKVAVRQPTERRQSGASDAASRALTEAEVIRSDNVLKLAAGKLGISQGKELKDSIEPEVVKGTDILEIKGRRQVPREASEWANAVAESYVEYRRTSMVENATATSGVISRAVQADSAKLEEVRDRIKAAPQDIAALRAEERRIAARVRGLQTQLLGLLDSEALRRGGAIIIERAQTPRKPAEPNWPRDLGLAGAAGIGTGAVLSLVATPPHTLRRKRRGAAAEPAAGTAIQGLTPPETLSHLDNRLANIEHEIRTGFSQIDGALQAAGPGETPASPSSNEILEKLGVWLNQRLNALDSRLDALQGAAGDRPKELETDLDSLIRAQQQPVINRIDDLSDRVATQLSVQGPAVASALEAVKRETLNEVREERLQMAERMAGLNHEMLQRFGKVAARVTQEMRHLRAEVVGKGATQQDGPGKEGSLEGPSEEVLVGDGGLGPDLAGFEQERGNPFAGVAAQASQDLQFRNDLIGQAEARGLATDLEHVKRGIVDEIREDRAHMMEKMAQENHELLQRFSRFAQNVGQALENLRDEALGKISDTQEGLAGMKQSVESKLEVEAKAFSGQIGGVLNQLAAQSQVIETRISQAAGQLNSSFVQKTDLNRAELIQRVATLEVEVGQRLGQVAMRLSDALSGVRNEVAEKLQVTERAIAGMLESMESGRKVESSEMSRRLSGVTAELSNHLEAVESRLLSSGESMKRKLEQGSRAELSRLAEGLSDIDHDAAERVSKLSASIKRSLSDLRSRVSEELSNQQLDLSSRLESLDAKVAKSTSATKGRKAPVVPIASAPSRSPKIKTIAKARSDSAKKTRSNGTKQKAKPASKSKR